MNKVARLKAAQRAELFGETASRLGLSDAVIEKDFWVCWTLKQIFSIEAFRDRFLFKGGTSLSKVFDAISRFSEDIDLAVDYSLLGFVGEKDPRQEGVSRSRQTRILAEMLIACARYIRTGFVPILRARLSEMLGEGGWTLTFDETDPHVVRFQYPKSGTPALSYIAPQVVLELGTHAEFVPRASFRIRSLAAREFPQIFEEPDLSVTALLAKRTFWEKVTILHAEFYRAPEKSLPPRYSRHYYDVALLGQTDIKRDAMADRELLARVVRHKVTFYPAAWARYDLATMGSLRLAPPEHRIAALRQDYRSMAVMIFGEPPNFDSLLGQLADMEQEINRG